MVLTDGATYEIRHPEPVLFGKRSAVIGLTGNPADVAWPSARAGQLMAQLARLERNATAVGDRATAN